MPAARTEQMELLSPGHRAGARWRMNIVRLRGVPREKSWGTVEQLAETRRVSGEGTTGTRGAAAATPASAAPC